MTTERIYQLALTLVPNIGDVHAKVLIQQYGQATAIFKAKRSELEKIEGIGEVRARSIKEFTDFATAEKELAFVEKYRIQPLFLTDSDYPQRLLNCYDSPTLLFYRGSADLNAPRMVSVVGTRKNTEYGKQFTETLIDELARENVTIVSGLAYGIDAIAHKAALKGRIPTVGVVGHGLDKIYPAAHANLARDMIREGGGILSEFFSGTGPDKHHFPLRNRIVAGLSDATIVVETEVRGGSMITAKMADGYNRDVFALPGRTTDRCSSGCNHLIQHNKAFLLNGASDLLDVLGWKQSKKKVKEQRELFIEFTPEEKQLIDLLQEKETVHIDEINLRTALSSSTIAATILNLELQNIITSLPGKLYKLV